MESIETNKPEPKIADKKRVTKLGESIEKIGTRTKILIVLTITMVYVAGFGYQAFRTDGFNFDFVAFYCGGQVSDIGANPYLTEPLRTCEHQILPPRHGIVALPVPLPAYDIGFFRIVSRVPFAIAQILWTSSLLLIVIFAMEILTKMLHSKRWVVWSIFGLSVGYQSIYLGQIFPISFLGIVLLGLALERKSGPIALFGTLLAAIEPHLGLVAIGTAFICGTVRMRIAITAGGTLLAIASVLAMPYPQIYDYFTNVLRVHALSEINNVDQFSTAYYLHKVGVSENLSVSISSWFYLATVVTAFAVARPLANRYGKPMAVWGGVSISLLFGPFLHVTQIAVVGLAALLGYTKTKSRTMGAAVALTSVPWLDCAMVLVVAPLVMTIQTALLTAYAKVRPTVAILASFILVYAAGTVVYNMGSVDRGHLLHTTATATSYAEVSWRELLDFHNRATYWLFPFTKIPTHLAVFLVVGSLIRGLRSTFTNDGPTKIIVVEEANSTEPSQSAALKA